MAKLNCQRISARETLIKKTELGEITEVHGEQKTTKTPKDPYLNLGSP